MKTAILIFDGLTALDAIGAYEVLASVPGAEVSFVSLEPGPKRTDSGATALVADRVLEEVGDPDVVLVPGGEGNRRLLSDERTLGWLLEVSSRARWTTSVCTGSLVLGAAGLLEGRRATSHWFYREQLRQYGAEPVAERVVFDGSLITAAGVSAGIDMALRLLERELGGEVAWAVQLGIEYDPDPPFEGGSPERTPRPIIELATEAMRGRQPELLSAGDPDPPGQG